MLCHGGIFSNNVLHNRHLAITHGVCTPEAVESFYSDVENRAQKSWPFRPAGGGTTQRLYAVVLLHAFLRSYSTSRLIFFSSII